MKTETKVPANDLYAELTNEIESMFNHLRNMIDKKEIDILNKLNACLENNLNTQITPSDISYQSEAKGTDYSTISKYFKKILYDFDRPLAFNALYQLADKEKLVPVQIVNPKSYLLRRLHMACKNGEFLQIRSETNCQIYYYLPEWHDITKQTV